ncbi:hypothetical protein TURU_005742 [Turdus rufiventris]|nr:hypothetical protein TURU_005742 [Turdus rufiventris]
MPPPFCRVAMMSPSSITSGGSGVVPYRVHLIVIVSHFAEERWMYGRATEKVLKNNERTRVSPLLTSAESAAYRLFNLKKTLKGNQCSLAGETAYLLNLENKFCQTVDLVIEWQKDPGHLLTQTQLDQCWNQDQDPISWISAGTRISIPSAGSALEPGLAKSSPRMEELEEFTQHLLQMLRSAGAEELLGCGLKSLEQIEMW